MFIGEVIIHFGQQGRKWPKRFSRKRRRRLSAKVNFAHHISYESPKTMFIRIAVVSYDRRGLKNDFGRKWLKIAEEINAQNTSVTNYYRYHNSIHKSNRINQ